MSHGLVGSVVGEYKVVARLGSGAMGAVYEGVHPVIGKRAAIKVLHAHLTSDPTLIDRFIAEARAVNEVRHRGIVDIFGFGQLEDGAPYFIMEFLEGSSFDAYLKKEAPLELRVALAFFAELLDAVAAAHEASIIHRDLKPQNIFLVRPTRGAPFIKVLDFGIAKLLTSPGVTRTRGDLMGTPQYMAPEVVKGAPVDARTDVYALGIILFEMLTGQRPIGGTNSLHIMRNQVELEPPLVSHFRPDVPPRLEALVAQMLAKEPAARPPSCDAVLAVLRTIELPGAESSAAPLPARAPAVTTGNAPAPPLVSPLVPPALVHDTVGELAPIDGSPSRRTVPSMAIAAAIAAVVGGLLFWAFSRATRETIVDRPTVLADSPDGRGDGAHADALGQAGLEAPPPEVEGAHSLDAGAVSAPDAAIALSNPRPEIVPEVRPLDPGRRPPAKRPALTKASLELRLAGLESQLGRQTRPDPLLKRYLERSRTLVEQAGAASELKKASEALDDFERELRHPR